MILRANSTSSRRPLLHALLATALVACDAGTIDAPADAGLAPPDRVGQPLDAVLDPLPGRAIRYAAAVADGTILADSPAGLLRVRTSTAVPIGTEAGLVAAVGQLDGTALVAGALGLFAVVDDRLEPSPITDAIGAIVPSDLAVTDDGRVWIASNRGLFEWRGGASVRIDPAGLPSADARLSFGAPIDGAPAMWVLSAGQLYGVTLDAASAHPQAFDADIGSLATASDGTLWIVVQGTLHSRATSEDWRAHDAIVDAVRVVAADDGAVWIETMDGTWRHHDGEFREVRGVPRPVHSAATEGSVLAGERLTRVFPTLSITFTGLDEGALVRNATEVALKPLLAERLVSLEATLDGAAIDIGTGPWSVRIDPTALTDGTHILSATATYDDGATVTSVRRFSYFAGPVPNWQDDVAPLFAEHCEVCHGARASARKLDTIALWREEIDLILFNVREGRMPLMPNRALTAAEIGVIEGWAAAEFPVDGE